MPMLLLTWSHLELGYRAGHFRRISSGFCTFERYFVRWPCDRIEPIFDVNTVRSAPRRLHAAWSQELEGGRRGPTERPGSYGHWSLCNLLYHRVTTCAFLRGLILLLRRPTGRGSSSMRRDCLLVASRVCDRFRQSSLFPIDLTYSKETLNTYHLSRGICWLVPRVRGSASSDSLSLLCLIFRTD